MEDNYRGEPGVGPEDEGVCENLCENDSSEKPRIMHRLRPLDESEPDITPIALKPSQARDLLFTGIRSCNGIREAINCANIEKAAFYFGWLDACLTELVNALPDDIKPPETRGGGGSKPRLE